MARPQLTVVDPGELPEYPLATDLRLTGHYFTMFWHDRWLYSRLRLTASPAVRGLALDLFALSQKQAPVGTLPDDDAELAALLLVPLREWTALRAEEPSPLYKWTRCVSDQGEVRLMHPVVLEVLQGTVDRRQEGARARDAWNQRKRFDRLREKIVDAGGTQAMAKDEVLLEQIDGWLTEHCPGNRTVARVREALEAVGRDG